MGQWKFRRDNSRNLSIKKTLVKYVNIKGKVCKDKSPFMFTYLDGYVDIVRRTLITPKNS